MKKAKLTETCEWLGSSFGKLKNLMCDFDIFFVLKLETFLNLWFCSEGKSLKQSYFLVPSCEAGRAKPDSVHLCEEYLDVEKLSRGFCRGVRLTAVTVVRIHGEKLSYKNCWTVSLWQTHSSNWMWLEVFSSSTPAASLKEEAAYLMGFINSLFLKTWAKTWRFERQISKGTLKGQTSTIIAAVL